MRVKILLCCLVILGFVLLAFSQSIQLVKERNRVLSYSLPIELKNQIAKETKGFKESDIINYGISLTTKKLQFSKRNDIKLGKANCVGYAQLCSAICNYALQLNGYSTTTRPVVGHLELCQTNLCNMAKNIVPNGYKNFVKDHDFIEIQEHSRIYYLDPCAYDLIKNPLFTLKEKE